MRFLAASVRPGVREEGVHLGSPMNGFTDGSRHCAPFGFDLQFCSAPIWMQAFGCAQKLVDPPSNFSPGAKEALMGSRRILHDETKFLTWHLFTFGSVCLKSFVC